LLQRRKITRGAPRVDHREFLASPGEHFHPAEQAKILPYAFRPRRTLSRVLDQGPGGLKRARTIELVIQARDSKSALNSCVTCRGRSSGAADVFGQFLPGPVASQVLDPCPSGLPPRCIAISARFRSFKMIQNKTHRRYSLAKQRPRQLQFPQARSRNGSTRPMERRHFLLHTPAGMSRRFRVQKPRPCSDSRRWASSQGL